MSFFIVAMLVSGVAIGYELGVSPIIINSFTNTFHITDRALPFIVSLLSLSAALSGIVCGFLADRFGRRFFFQLAVILFVFGIFESAIAHLLAEFILGRVLLGVAIGMLVLLIPLYIVELAPAHQRGQLIAAYFLAINTGLFIASFSGFLFSTDLNWRLIILFGFLPMVFVFAVLIYIPESPRWLLLQGQFVLAKQVQRTLFKDSFKNSKKGYFDLSEKTDTKCIKLSDPRGLQILLVGMLINIFAQAVGVHAVAVYSTFMNVSHDFNVLTVNGIIAFSLMTGAFLSLRVIDTLSRRRMLLLGMAGITTSLILMSWALHSVMDPDFMAFIVLSACTLFMGCQGFSLAPIASLLPAELFPQAWRAGGFGICISVYWITNIIVVYAFPHMLIECGAAISFLIFLLFTAIGSVWFYFNIPETMQVNLDVLEKNLYDGVSNRYLGIDDALVDVHI